MRAGTILSFLFHLAIALLLILGLPDLFKSEEMVVEPVAVQLATVADLTTAPKPIDAPPKPVTKPTDTPPPPAPQAPTLPAPPTPPTPPIPPQAEQAPSKPVEAPPPPPSPPTPPQPQPVQTLPDLPQPEVIPDKTQETPPPQEAKVETPPLPQLRPPQPDKPKPKPKPEQKPAQQPADFNSLLKSVEQMKTQTAAAETPPDTPVQPSEATPSQLGSQLTASELDALKSQITSHFNFDAGKKGVEGIVVDVRVTAGPDGTVIGIPEIVDSGRMATDPIFRSVAEAARRAIQLSSPLKLPPGKYDVWRDGSLVVRFTPGGVL